MSRKEKDRVFYKKMLERTAGVFQIKNIKNGKIFIGSGEGIESTVGRIFFELRLKSYRIKEFQNDFNKFKEENFEWSILEKIERDDDIEQFISGEKNFEKIQAEVKNMAKELELKWIEKLNPFDQNGYNIMKKKVKNRKVKIEEKKQNISKKRDKVDIVTLSEHFWNSDLDQMEQGYCLKDGYYICLICGKHFEDGLIFKDGDNFYEAKKWVQKHIEKEHGSVFSKLIDIDKRYSGISDTQKELLNYFIENKGDKEIAKLMDISPSTVRNHRFKLKEREKQAKVFLTLLNIVHRKLDKKGDNFISIHKNAKMVDDRYSITEKDRDNILKKTVLKGRLKQLPTKEREKIVVLYYIVKKFEYGVLYSENEINKIVKQFCDDYVTVRRYFIEYGFMERTKNCTQYWLKN